MIPDSPFFFARGERIGSLAVRQAFRPSADIFVAADPKRSPFAVGFGISQLADVLIALRIGDRSLPVGSAHAPFTVEHRPFGRLQNAFPAGAGVCDLSFIDRPVGKIDLSAADHTIVENTHKFSPIFSGISPLPVQPAFPDFTHIGDTVGVYERSPPVRRSHLPIPLIGGAIRLGEFPLAVRRAILPFSDIFLPVRKHIRPLPVPQIAPDAPFIDTELIFNFFNLFLCGNNPRQQNHQNDKKTDSQDILFHQNYTLINLQIYENSAKLPT